MDKFVELEDGQSGTVPVVYGLLKITKDSFFPTAVVDTWAQGTPQACVDGQMVFNLSKTPNPLTVSFAVDGILLVNGTKYTVVGSEIHILPGLEYQISSNDVVQISYTTLE
jgi:hypothetical protein